MSETITAEMSRWAAGLKFDDIGEEAVHEARRYTLDSLGCALGGYRQEDTQHALDVLDEVAGSGPATILGSGKKTDVVSATLANALMVRVMDYNDIYWQQDPSHPSDIIPAAIACAERQGSDGKELIVGIVLGHEFEMRFCEAAFPGIRERGWHHATLTAFVSPIVAGRLLRLNWEEIQHAIGISASRHATLGAVTAGKLTMMKNTVDPMATQSRSHGGAAGREGLHGTGARDRRQGGARPLSGPGMEARVAHRWARGGLANRALWDEGVPDRGAHPRADLRRARAGQGARPAAGSDREGADLFAGARG